MCVEVRQLVIKAAIAQDSHTNASPAPKGNSDNANQELIKACVEKVLEILKEKNGR